MSQPNGLSLNGNKTFIPKKPVTMVGTVNNNDQIVNKRIVSFKLLFNKLL